LAARKTSPVERWHAPRLLWRSSACVPFPTPGAPRRTSRQGWATCAGHQHLAEGPSSQAARSLLVEELIVAPMARCWAMGGNPPKDSGYRGGLLNCVTAVTAVCEGGVGRTIRCNPSGRASKEYPVQGSYGRGEMRPKNETSQTQRVTGRSPEQPSPKCCSRTSLPGRRKYGNGTDGLYGVTNECARGAEGNQWW